MLRILPGECFTFNTQSVGFALQIGTQEHVAMYFLSVFLIFPKTGKWFVCMLPAIGMIPIPGFSAANRIFFDCLPSMQKLLFAHRLLQSRRSGKPPRKNAQKNYPIAPICSV